MNKTNLRVWYSSNITFYATSQSFIIFRVETHNDVGLFVTIYQHFYVHMLFIELLCWQLLFLCFVWFSRFQHVHQYIESGIKLICSSIESFVDIVHIYTFYYAYLTMFDNVIPSCDMLCLSIYIGYKKLGYIQ